MRSGAALACPERGALGGLQRHENDRPALRVAVLGELVGEHEAVDLFELALNNVHVGLDRGDHRHGASCRRGAVELNRRRHLEHRPPQLLAETRVVVDDQDLRAGHTYPLPYGQAVSGRELTRPYGVSAPNRPC